VRTDPERIKQAYALVRQRCQAEWNSREAGSALWDLAVRSLEFLTNRCSTVSLVSRVPGKRYVSYARRSQGSVVSRPVNTQLFLPAIEELSGYWEAWSRGDRLPSRTKLAKMCYTMALAPCLAMELFDRQNKKGPATYFECFVGHVFARALGTQPARSATLPVAGRSVQMTMDFLFEMETGANVHLAAKMSTRERVVQAWAHQRMLDSACGQGAYIGIMALFCETKLDSRSHEVVEICVPDQWLAYQTFLSRMERIYYFDTPYRYRALTTEFRDAIQIGEFVDVLTGRGAALGLRR
jgi:hypothetical protein